MNKKEVNTDPRPPRESFSGLFVQLLKSLAAIVHSEIELVTQRFREQVKNLHGGVMMVATGVIISFVAFMTLCAALVIGLASFMPLVFAATVTGTALGAIGIVIAAIGYGQLKKSFLKKQKTTHKERQEINV